MKWLWLLLLSSGPCWAAKSRVTSVYLAENFINEQLQSYAKPDGLLRDLKVELDTKEKQVYLRGLVQIPVEELHALNLDPSLRAYRFQVTIKPEATEEGYLILEFPLAKTFFYPASSKNPTRDRVVIPVQMLSLALASARGYFAALSGDFSGFSRKEAKVRALIKEVNRSLAREKDADAREALSTERDSLRLQLAAVPIERRQFTALAKQVGGMLRFTGEKELNLNETFSARQNALIIRLNLASFVPYLSGVSLGGVRLVHDSRDGMNGENYFAVDISAAPSGEASATLDAESRDPQEGLKVAPSAMIRISQTLFDSKLVVDSQKKAMGSKLSDLKIDMKEDGLHVSGRYHKFFFSIPFDTVVDFNESENVDDAFDISVRDVEVAGLDLQFMTGFILESLKSRFDQSLRSVCTFEYVGLQKDHARSLRVHLNPAQLIPALPGMHLVDIEVRDREFLLKVGRL